MTEAFKASKKIGIKLLDDDQLAFTFPQCGDLKNRIDSQRERARIQKELGNLDPTFHLMHDNIYAIFGGRGTGKTSVLYSLRASFQKTKEQSGDLILPIIMPEIISNNENSLLGWVLAVFEDIVGELEREIAAHSQRYDVLTFQQECKTDFFENCRFNKRNKLRLLYDSIYKDCFSQQKGISDQYSYADVVSMKANQSKIQYALMKRLNEFWNLLADTSAAICRHKTREQNRGYEDRDTLMGNKRPLIFVMFDDIDLEPDRSMELLGSAFKYFANPNVVIILTAAKRALEHVLRCKMYEKVVGSDFPSLLQGNMLHESRSVIQSAEEQTESIYQIQDAVKAAKEYLDKVIPPSSRYFLERYETLGNKRLFRYSAECMETPQYGRARNSASPLYTSQSIEQLLVEQIKSLEAFVNCQQAHFLYHSPAAEGKSQPQQFLDAYLLMFGNKNRHIANGCLSIINAVDELKSLYDKTGATDSTEINGRYRRELYHILLHLFEVLLTSNPKVAKYSERLSTLMQYEKDGWFLYMAYSEILNLYEEEILKVHQDVIATTPELENRGVLWEQIKRFEIKKRYGEIKNSLSALFIIMFFVEQLILIMLPERNNVHGFREIIDFMNRNVSDDPMVEKDGTNLKLFQNKKTVNDVLLAYCYALENLTPFILFDERIPLNVYNYFFTVYYNESRQMELSAEGHLGNCPAEQNCLADLPWGQTALTLLNYMESGILLMEKVDLKQLESFSINIRYWGFGGPIANQLHEQLRDFLKEGTPSRSGANLATYSERKVQEFWSLATEQPLTALKSSNTIILNSKKQLDFSKLLEDLRIKNTSLKDMQPYLKICWQCPENIEDMSIKCTKIIGFVNGLIDSCLTQLKNNRFVIYLDKKEASELAQRLGYLKNISPQFDLYARRLKDSVTKHKSSPGSEIEEPKALPIRAGLYFLLIQELHKYLNHTVQEYDVDYYFEILSDLIRHCQTFYCLIDESASGENPSDGPEGLGELAHNMLLLLYVTPYYFPAKFLLEDEKQYNSWRLHSVNNRQPKEMGVQRFLMIYQNILQFIESNPKSTLAEIHRQTNQRIVDMYADTLPE